MDLFEKTEKLVNVANVSYEDAKEALENSGEDLLDAMIYLERNGKTDKPDVEKARTDRNTGKEYEEIPEMQHRHKSSNEENFGKKLGRGCKKFGDFLCDNHMVAYKDGKVKADFPFWAILIMALASWGVLLVLIIVSFFFGWNYKFTGKNDLSQAQNVMDAVNGAADQIREGFENKQE